MHPNPAFRQVPRAAMVAFAGERGFGTLAVNAAPAPLLSHIPFFLDEEGNVAELHLVRSNPIVPLAREGVPAVISVSGPDGYISPDWYGVDGQVPTWNYIAVHLRGILEPLPEEELPQLLDRLSAVFEARLAPKPAWTRAKMATAAFERMLRMILPFRLRVEAVEGTWKLSQNKPEAARLAAADGLEQGGFGMETAALAAWMRRGGA
jgi:transcriptional regulator